MVKGKFEGKRHFLLLFDSQALTDIGKSFMIFSDTSSCAVSEFWKCLPYLFGNT